MEIKIAIPTNSFEHWHYIMGNNDMSICKSRFYHLRKLCAENNNELKVSLKDIHNKSWTKWINFPYKLINNGNLTAALDVHRSVLSNEIVIESDYPDYIDNMEASRLIGQIVEQKGFLPAYYYSGNKSIHIHIYLDWDIFANIKSDMKTRKDRLFKTEKRFREKFILWLRDKMISCWDTGVREFDKELIRSTHLIRSEMSRNKKGYKTFIGYSYKDLSFIPYICNEKNRIYPQIGDYKLSRPHNPDILLDEFMTFLEAGRTKSRINRTRSLKDFKDNDSHELRGCIKFILSGEFRAAGDGTSRAMFILINELKQIFGRDIALIMLHEWNERMGNAVSESDIRYRMNMKDYTLSCDFIHRFLDELGFDVSKKCNDNIYK